MECSTPIDITSQKRREYIKTLFHNKTVLHVGCLDHRHTILDKIKTGLWMHGILRETTLRCAGIDIDEDCIKALRVLGVSDLYYADVRQPAPVALSSFQWDYIFLGEVLEHIGDPQEFLIGIHQNYANFCVKFCITVPYIHSAQNFFMALSGHEQVNTDHRLWFTQSSFLGLLKSAGFVVEKLAYVNPVDEVFIGRMRKLYADSFLIPSSIGSPFGHKVMATIGHFMC